MLLLIFHQLALFFLIQFYDTPKKITEVLEILKKKKNGRHLFSLLNLHHCCFITIQEKTPQFH